MSLMLRLSSLIAISSLIVNAEFNLENYVKKDLVKNPNVKVESVELIEKVKIKEAPNWDLYMFIMNLKYKGRDDVIPEKVFVNEKENIVTSSLYNYKTHKDIGKNIRPKLKPDYYSDDHLIAGNKSAKHKIVVFSDPKCPFCQKYIPKMYEDVKKSPDEVALYYYHMPLLRIHPASDVLVRVMEHLQKKGKFDDAMKMYNLKISYRETNTTKILAQIKKQFGIDIKEEDINKPEIKKAIESDINKANRIMITGTPTVYIDGEFQPKVDAYKQFLKKEK